MPDILITRRHALGLDGARRAAAEVAERLRQEFGVAVRHAGDAIHVEASLGLAARPFRRLLHREIESELDRLAPAS